MTRIYFFISITFFLSFQVIGQSQVSGLLLESGSKPLPFANVLLLQAKDSSLVKGAVTDERGRYSFEKIINGNYVIKAFMLGYKPAYSPLFTVAGGNFRVKP
jgi:hypothetical protein